MVLAAQGTCLTLGVELALAADVVVAADSTRFAQLEVARGIMAFGGATIRLPRLGWGDAMRWLLTGDFFDAAEALRIGLVQQVVPHGEQVDAAIAIAERIAARDALGLRTLGIIEDTRVVTREQLDAAFKAADEIGSVMVLQMLGLEVNLPKSAEYVRG